MHAYRSQFFSSLAKATTVLIDMQARLISYIMLLEVPYVVAMMTQSTCVTNSSLKVVAFIVSCYGDIAQLRPGNLVEFLKVILILQC